METQDRSEQMAKVYDILHRLGISANYNGFFYIAYAVWLCLHEPKRLTLVTQLVYPVVADHYGSNDKAVERNIRWAIKIARRNNPQLIADFVSCDLQESIRPSQLLSVLVREVNPFYIESFSKTPPTKQLKAAKTV